MSKFFTRVFYESGDISCINETIKKLIKEFEEMQEKKEKKLD